LCINNTSKICYRLFTNKIPHLEAPLLQNLEKNGIVILEIWVETGDILVGKLMPQMANEIPLFGDSFITR
jgi:DNA-directed RNA polymerase beta subunit